MGERNITVIPNQPWMNGKVYHSYICSRCGEDARNTYCEPHYTRMIKNLTCFTCDYWDEFEEKHKPESLTVIDGHCYTPGNRTSGEFRGMAGRRFDIEYIEPSIYAGQKITTFDLWSGSALPERLRAKFPDTARFLGGAEKAQVGETTCWDGSDRKGDPFPLPRSLVPNIAREAKP